MLNASDCVTTGESLTLTKSGSGGRAIRLKLTGQLDLASAETLRTKLVDLQREGTPVELDLFELIFMDISGIGVVIEAVNYADQDGGSGRSTATVRARCGG